jgi:glycerol uptake facilitator-like aquaporin
VLPVKRRVAAEAVATALLLAAVVGSGIMGERLARGNDAIALLANTLATAAALVALILTFGPVSGAHMNPVVTVALALRRELRWREAASYVPAQFLGAIAGVAAAPAMFGEPVVSFSRHARSGAPQLLGEFIATFGLLATIASCARHRTGAMPAAVAAWIAGAYWFTSSTSFANPAVTLARSLTDTFCGIRPQDVPGFVLAQAAGAAAAVPFMGWLIPKTAPA